MICVYKTIGGAAAASKRQHQRAAAGMFSFGLAAAVCSLLLLMGVMMLLPPLMAPVGGLLQFEPHMPRAPTIKDNLGRGVGHHVPTHTAPHAARSGTRGLEIGGRLSSSE